MRANALSLAALALALPAGVAAQVYKCADPQGKTVYQDAACPPGRELRNFAVDPPPVSVVPLHAAPGTTTRLTAPPTPRVRPAQADRNAKMRTGNPGERRHIHPGMHEGEVLARIGTPDMKSSGGRKQSRWTYLPDPRDPQTLTTVVFETGRVVEVERKVMR